MKRILAAALFAASLIAPTMSSAQEAKAPAAPATAKASTPKLGKDQKVCRYKFPGDAKVTTWTCQKEQPCCAWDAIHYVKCGSTITNCL